MFDFVNKKKRIVQIVLAVATLPFLFWGIESYRTGEGEDFVARVSGENISRQEFDQAFREQQDSMRATMGENFDADLLNRPEMRAAVLDGLVQQRLLKHESQRVGLAIPDAQLVEMIRNISAFQEDGDFSKERYEELLRGQGMSPRMFEARVRQELMRQQLVAPFGEIGFISDSVAERLMRLSGEKREASFIEILPEQFASRIQPDDAAIQTYYDSHQAEFQLPEQVRVEYAVLSMDDLASQSGVSAEEARNYFEAHKEEFGQPEERRASHILISVPADAPDAQKNEARTRAQQLLQQIKQNPGSFADLAKQHSQDPGSAANGGDLGFFARNTMVKRFEDAVFQMKPGEISDVIETDFGFHIVRLDAIKEGKPVDFGEVRNQVEQEVRREKAAQSFGEAADGFSNTVYEQSDSLKPVAEKYGLTIRQSDWIGRDGGEPTYFTNERLLQAVFSEDAIRDKRNTEAVEVSPNTLVSARVLDYRPARTPSVGELKDRIAGLIIREQASKAAIKEGKDKLAQLQEGKSGIVQWGSALLVSRREPQGLDGETMQAVFRTDVHHLPSYSGVPNSQGGYTLIRVNGVIEPPKPGADQLKAFARQLQEMIAQEEFSAYLAEIRKRYDVSVKNPNPEK